MGKSKNDRKRVDAVTNALTTISQIGTEIMRECEENMRIGWNDFNVGDEVYFKTYNDIDDVVMVTKGTIVEIIRRDIKVDNRPDSDHPDGWHTETVISYKVQWRGGKNTINARYVYETKLHATLAAITETVNSYFTV